MKVSVLQQDLAPLINTASRFVAAKAQLPILANIRLIAEKARLQIQATNLEMAITTSVGAKVVESGELAVPAKTLTDLIATLPQGQINLSTQDEHLEVSCEGVSANLSGMNTADFPEIQNNIDTPSVSISPDAFLSALTKVLFATSLDDTRPQLTGVLLSVEGKLLRVVSTDGFRLSKTDARIDSESAFAPVIIPRGVLAELTKLAKGASTLEYSFSESKNQVQFLIDKTLLSSKIIAGAFPPYEKHIPTVFKTKISLSKKDLGAALKTAAVFARENANLITLSIATDGVTLSANSSQSGEQKSVLDAKVEGEPLTIVYNCRYLEEVLGVIGGETVVFEFQDSLSTGVVRDPSDENFVYLVGPVKA